MRRSRSCRRAANGVDGARRSEIGRAIRLFALAGTISASVLLGASSAFAANAGTVFTTSWVDSPVPGTNARFAERLTEAKDLTGDGVRDVFASSYVQSAGGVAEAGRVALISGGDRSIRYSLTSPDPETNAHFGFYISVPGDVNGDGNEDVVVGTDAQDVYTGTGTQCGTPEPNGCNENQGRAYVFSGPTGTLIRRIENPHPQANARFGSRIGSAGDVNRDGRADIITSAIANDVPAGCGELNPKPADCRQNQGQAWIFSGASGAMLREFNIPPGDERPATCTAAGDCGNLGYAPQVVGDLTGDGVPDHLVPAGSYRAGTPPNPQRHGRLYIFNGATGGLLSRIDQPVPDPSAFFGLYDVDRFAPGDLNADGVPEIFGSAFSQDGPGGEANAGRAWIFDGRASVQQGVGVVLYELRDPTPQASEAFGWSASRTDYNKDGRPDIFLTGLQGLNRDAYVYDGRDGSLLKTISLPASEAQPNAPGNNGSALGWSSRAPGDLNNDCEPDYSAAAPYQDVGGTQDQGKVFFFLSSGPSTCPRATPPRPTYPRPYPPPLVPFAGCPSSTANVILGTAGNDTRNGTAGADRIFTGAGNDLVDGLPGDDCIDLGPGNDLGQGGLGSDLMVAGTGGDRVSGSSGNDRLRGNAGNDRLVAGRGNDRVFGDAGNDTLLGSFGNDVLHGVSGRDRITGSRGRDGINGGSSNDVISGGSSGDRVAGDQGNDRITGNSGNDRLSGNSGRDRITGSSGRDSISGGAGNDRVSARDGQRDRVSCGRGADTVTADRSDRVARDCERVRRR